jgi:hypothetical protein
MILPFPELSPECGKPTTYIFGIAIGTEEMGRAEQQYVLPSAA